MRIKLIVSAASCLALMAPAYALAGTFEKNASGVVVKPDQGAAGEVRLALMNDNIIHVEIALGKADGGTTWTRFNDDAHQFGGIGVMAADWNVYGRIYVSGTGRGLFYSN